MTARPQLQNLLEQSPGLGAPGAEQSPGLGSPGADQRGHTWLPACLTGFGWLTSCMIHSNTCLPACLLAS
jgi:hypothetical protein